ncbi:MAG TPA: protein kinase [Gemmataceae bacterium]|nr:protein kinase [Gemmataceae bacterium]
MEPIPGYRLVEPLGVGGFGEVWKCEAPGGLFKAVKFVRGDNDDLHRDSPAGAEQELRALQHIKSLRHPFLLSMDRVERINGELVIVMELADRSLHDLLGECQAAGLPGVPRTELLRYFEEAAEVLDLLNQEHALQHLDVKPRNLFLVGRHVKVGDFGLVNSLAEMSGVAPSALQMGAGTPLYAAPECFLGRMSLFSDQYSLAIAYCELLTGATPFTGKNFRQMALQHMQAEPDLGQLSASDSAVVARALAKEPRQRFPSCTAFVEALRTGQIAAPVGPPPSAPQRPKGITCADISVVDLTKTPVAAAGPGAKQAAVPPAGDTRQVDHARNTPTEPLRPPLSGEQAAEVTPVAPTGTQRLQPPLSPPAGEGSGVRATNTVASSDPLAGMQFLECIARSPAGETWTARTADGRDRLVRFIFGMNFSDGRKEAEGLARLRTLRHDALEPMEIVGGGDHRLAILTDPCTTTLASRLAECQAAGQTGLPRAELLAYLGEAGQALDALSRSHGVRHLGLTPRHLTLRNGRLRLLHFGLVELIHAPAGQSPAALNPRYAAPELFENRPHASSDVYSLALIYYELLTGAHPFRAFSPRQMTSARQRIQPDLSLAPATDRIVLERALIPDPARRTPNCAELLAALSGAARPGANRAVTSVAPSLDCDLELTPTTRTRMRQAINGLVAAAAGDLQVREFNNTRYLLHPGRSLEHQFFARLPPGMARLRLRGFGEEWHAERLQSDGEDRVYLVSTAGGGLQRLLGRKPGIKVSVAAPPPAQSTGLTEVTVRMEPVRCQGEAAVHLLEETGPLLLKSLRDHLQALPDRRNQARLRLEGSVRVAPVVAGSSRGQEILSEAKDISLRGMGLLMPCRPPSMLLHILLPADAPGQEMEVPACIVRASPQPDGRYEVGVRFLVEEH